MATPRAADRDDNVDDFRTLFVATYPRVVRTVWFVVHDHEVAEEVAQEAFLELYRRWHRVRDYDEPALWVRRVAIRKAQREAARAGRRPDLERRASVLPPTADGPTADHEELLSALRSLPPRQRAVVVLYYLDDRPMAEVADLVGCTTSTGYAQLHHARRRLAAALGSRSDTREEVDRELPRRADS